MQSPSRFIPGAANASTGGQIQSNQQDRRRQEINCRSDVAQQLLNAASGLADALLVLDQGDPDPSFALLAEADPGADRHIGLGKQPL